MLCELRTVPPLLINIFSRALICYSFKAFLSLLGPFWVLAPPLLPGILPVVMWELLSSRPWCIIFWLFSIPSICIKAYWSLYFLSAIWLVESCFFVVDAAVIVTVAICCYYVCCKGRAICGETSYYCYCWTEEEDGGVGSCVDGVGS